MFCKRIFWPFGVRRGVIETSKVCKIFGYSHYTTAVGVPDDDGCLVPVHYFLVCHSSDTCKILSYDVISAIRIS